MNSLTSNVGVKGNVRYVTISSNVPSQWDELITVARQAYTSYWAINHNKDIYSQDDNVTPNMIGKCKPEHLHLVCYDEAGTSLKAHCQRFSHVIAPNFIEKVKSPRAMLRYLVHMDNPEKARYDSQDITTNNPDKLASSLRDVSRDCLDDFKDFVLLRDHKITPQQYIEKHRADFDGMGFYNKVATFERIARIYGL